MKLNQLLKTNSGLEILNLVTDSRLKVEQGLFFCIKGTIVDGHKFVDNAIQNGCVAVIHSDDIEKQENIVYIKVDDVKNTLNHVASTFYDHPSQKMYVYGITGTNGKTTIMKTLHSLLERLGVIAGYIGTLSIEYNGRRFANDLTTPDILNLQRILSDMVNDNVTDVCIEVSSHGLEMHRVDSVNFDSIGFTNLTHDHLDYHETMENYFKSKLRLFHLIKPNKIIVVNNDDDYGKRIVNLNLPENTFTYGIKNPSDYFAKDIRYKLTSTHFTLVHKNTEYEVTTNFIAEFNVYNILAVIAFIHQRGYDLSTIIKELAFIKPIEGRQTVVDDGQDFNIVIDYAHTPDAVQKIMEFARKAMDQDGKLIIVNGAAGLRDHLKRSVIGRIMSSLSDYVILTEDDSHGESLETIIDEIKKGMLNDCFMFVPDRYAAIKEAIRMAKPHDTILILGKGQERHISRSNKRESWIGDDLAASEILKHLQLSKRKSS